jgi:hypothetical protein
MGEFNAYTTWYAPWQKRARRKFLINFIFYIFSFVFSGIILLDAVRGKETNIVLAIITSLVTTLITSVISYYNEPLSIKKKVRKFLANEENKCMLNEDELWLTERGLLKKGINSYIEVKWVAVNKFISTKGYFYLYTNEFQAYVIPKRLFGSQKEIDIFNLYLTEKIPLMASLKGIK